MCLHPLYVAGLVCWGWKLPVKGGDDMILCFTVKCLSGMSIFR